MSTMKNGAAKALIAATCFAALVTVSGCNGTNVKEGGQLGETGDQILEYKRLPDGTYADVYLETGSGRQYYLDKNKQRVYLNP